MRCGILILAIVTAFINADGQAQEFPDIRSVTADLEIPGLQELPAAAGKRVRQTLGKWEETQVYHVLYLPTDWLENAEGYPVLVEWAGNGGYTNAYGDISSGRPEGSKLGYGLSAGRQFIWLCLPYLNEAGDDLAIQWWGDPPNYVVQPTIEYCQAAISSVCQNYGGDKNNVVLCGFSRGAIACNYLGLHNDEIAGLWRGFFAYSHYDGLRRWPFPNSDRESALTRLGRLKERPQFICAEGRDWVATQQYLKPSVAANSLTIMGTGFRNHNDAWVLRPSPARDAARDWLKAAIREPE